MNHIVIGLIALVIAILLFVTLYIRSRRNSNVMPMTELLDFETDEEGNIIQGTLTPRASALMDGLIRKQEEDPNVDMEQAYSEVIEEEDPSEFRQVGYMDDSGIGWPKINKAGRPYDPKTGKFLKKES